MLTYADASSCGGPAASAAGAVGRGLGGGGDVLVDELLLHPKADALLKHMLLESRAPKVRAEACRCYMCPHTAICVLIHLT